MTQPFKASVFDRLKASSEHAPTCTLEQLKDAVARDLELLLNTRVALPESMFASYPEAGNSVVNYGLIDFAGMCMTSDADRKKICSAVKRAIEQHEPRLHAVQAELRVHCAPVNRVDFVISALLKSAVTAAVQFDAVLEPSSQHYSIRKVRSMHKTGAA